MKHILIDVLDKDLVVEPITRKVLSERCELVIESKEPSLCLYVCRDGVVYLNRVANVLLLDVLGAEEVFDALLKVLPRQYLMVRLLERGVPLE